MKHIVTLTCLAVLCCSFFLLSVPCGYAQNDQGNGPPCSLKTLKGSYGTLFNGHVRDFPDPGQNPIVIEERETYDGAGNMTTVSASMLSSIKETASFAVALRRTQAGWRITGWAYSKQTLE